MKKSTSKTSKKLNQSLESLTLQEEEETTNIPETNFKIPPIQKNLITISHFSDASFISSDQPSLDKTNFLITAIRNKKLNLVSSIDPKLSKSNIAASLSLSLNSLEQTDFLKSSNRIKLNESSSSIHTAVATQPTNVFQKTFLNATNFLKEAGSDRYQLTESQKQVVDSIEQSIQQTSVFDRFDKTNFIKQQLRNVGLDITSDGLFSESTVDPNSTKTATGTDQYVTSSFYDTEVELPPTTQDPDAAHTQMTAATNQSEMILPADESHANSTQLTTQNQTNFLKSQVRVGLADHSESMLPSQTQNLSKNQTNFLKSQQRIGEKLENSESILPSQTQNFSRNQTNFLKSNDRIVEEPLDETAKTPEISADPAGQTNFLKSQERLENVSETNQSVPSATASMTGNQTNFVQPNLRMQEDDEKTYVSETTVFETKASNFALPEATQTQPTKFSLPPVNTTQSTTAQSTTIFEDSTTHMQVSNNSTIQMQVSNNNITTATETSEVPSHGTGITHDSKLSTPTVTEIDESTQNLTKTQTLTEMHVTEPDEFHDARSDVSEKTYQSETEQQDTELPEPEIQNQGSDSDSLCEAEPHEMMIRVADYPEFFGPQMHQPLPPNLQLANSKSMLQSVSMVNGKNPNMPTYEESDRGSAISSQQPFGYTRINPPSELATSTSVTQNNAEKTFISEFSRSTNNWTTQKNLTATHDQINASANFGSTTINPGTYISSAADQDEEIYQDETGEQEFVEEDEFPTYLESQEETIRREGPIEQASRQIPEMSKGNLPPVNESDEEEISDESDSSATDSSSSEEEPKQKRKKQRTGADPKYEEEDREYFEAIMKDRALLEKQKQRPKARVTKSKKIDLDVTVDSNINVLKPKVTKRKNRIIATYEELIPKIDTPTSNLMLAIKARRVLEGKENFNPTSTSKTKISDEKLYKICSATQNHLKKILPRYIRKMRPNAEVSENGAKIYNSDILSLMCYMKLGSRDSFEKDFSGLASPLNRYEFEGEKHEKSANLSVG